MNILREHHGSVVDLETVRTLISLGCLACNAQQLGKSVLEYSQLRLA